MNPLEFLNKTALEVEQIKKFTRKYNADVESVVLSPDMDDTTFILTFKHNDGRLATLRLPIPFTNESDNTIIQTNDNVFRAVPQFMVGNRTDKHTIDLTDLMFKILTTAEMPEFGMPGPAKSWLQLILKSFKYNNIVVFIEKIMKILKK